jgi:peptidoglycan/LPS O-acetylase OafA/YrhL
MPVAERTGLVTQPSSGRRLTGIEGLRGLAALLVIFRHVGQYTTDAERTGWLGRLSEWSTHGLTLFFVLSGFLLFRPFAAAVLARGELPSVRRYAANRALRILPAYFVVFTLACLVLGLASLGSTGTTDDQGDVGRLTDPTAIVLNLALLQTYVPGYVLTGISPAWSLTAEIAFYLVLPALAVAAAWLARRRVSPLVAVTAPAALLIVIGLTATTALSAARQGLSEAEADRFSWGQTWTAVLERSLVAQADLFGYGMLVAVLLVVLQRRRAAGVPPWWRAVVLVACLLLVLLPYVSPGGGRFSTNMVGLAAAGVLTAVVMPSSRASSGESTLARTLERPPIRYAGLISYSVYLWHVPVILGLERSSLTFGDDGTGLLLTTLLTTAVVVALATLTYVLVERPAMARRLPWRRG